MPDFRYRAINARGRVQSGVFTAPSEHILQSLLMQAGMTLIEARLDKKPIPAFTARGSKLRDLAQFCQHVSQLDRAGVKLTDALHDVTGTLQASKLKAELAVITREIEEGSSFSNAIAKRPDIFRQPMPALIAAGEASNRLADTLEHMATHYRWHDQLRSRVRRAISYPLFALVAMIAVTLFLVAYVVPETMQFLQNMNVSLPGHTKFLISVTNFVSQNCLSLVANVTAICVLCIYIYRQSQPFAYWVDAHKLRLPLIGELWRKLELTRFMRSLSMMTASGIDLVDALDIARHSVRNRAIRENIDIVFEQVRSGHSFYLSLRLSGSFTSLVERMVRMGEESGTLPAALDHVAGFYEDDVQHTTQSLAGAIGPAITLVTGSLLIWLVAALFAPIYDALPRLM